MILDDNGTLGKSEINTKCLVEVSVAVRGKAQWQTMSCEMLYTKGMDFYSNRLGGSVWKDLNERLGN